MNPEFKRNLWTEFSKHRLIVMPLSLLLLFYFSQSLVDGWQHILHHILIVMFLLTVVWGTGLSADAVFQEIQDHTWETQRMSPLSPWTFTIGKLFGSTAFVWYGSLFCILFYLFLSFSYQTSFSVDSLFSLGYTILIGIGSQAFALFVALLIQGIHPKRTRIRLLFVQLLSIFLFLFLFLLDQPQLFEMVKEPYSWYSFNIPYRPFLISSLLFIIAWLMIGLYRLFRTELQVKSIPWVWPIFMIMGAFYYAGFFYPIKSFIKLIDLPSSTFLITLVYFFMVYLTYFAAFFSPKNKVYALHLKNYLKSGSLLNVLYLTPTWVISVFILIPVLIINFILYNLNNFPANYRLAAIGALFASFLFLLRDIGILYYLCWTSKRGHLATIFYLIMLYWLIPAVLGVAGVSGFWIGPLSLTYWITNATTVTILQILGINALIIVQVALVYWAIKQKVVLFKN